MNGETAILVLWALGLVAALGLTAVVLKLLALLLRTLGQIRELAERTAEAAEGMAGVFSAPLGIGDAAEAADRLLAGSQALHASTSRVRNAVGGPRQHTPADRDDDSEIQGTSGAGELGGAAGGPHGGPGGEG